MCSLVVYVHGRVRGIYACNLAGSLPESVAPLLAALQVPPVDGEHAVEVDDRLGVGAPAHAREGEAVGHLEGAARARSVVEAVLLRDEGAVGEGAEAVREGDYGPVALPQLVAAAEGEADLADEGRVLAEAADRGALGPGAVGDGEAAGHEEEEE
ncbi:uncharacterized protein E0L32_010194 [Thyridium curvatum]|uniref:Uncharacterized protein n=1 Tax=Thyridium curvatum TaxID=1093900 RepID=A0A507ALS6_9PEZI|nr:uncharacterized protein E0L32_010194 [Thyridium curvatum]TPX08127.1 hypothetical protein E0L32_010194 [Thyridium curvatum]